MGIFESATLIVPIDYSDECVEAVRLAKQLAASGTVIHVIHVMPPVNDPNVASFGTESGLVDDRVRSNSRKAFEKWLSEQGLGENISVVVKVGDSGREIASHASEFANPLIVIPSHGRTGLSHFFLGSVAEKVTRYAHCPVLVLKRNETDSGFKFDCSQVLVPFDFSDDSIDAVKAATKLVAGSDSLHVVHALPNLGGALPYDLSSELDDDHRRKNTCESQTRALSTIAPNAVVHAVVGSPGDVVAELASHIGATLVVISSHGRTGLARMLLGSVAERIVRFTHCSVLVLKPEHVAEARLSELDKPAKDEVTELHYDDLLEVYSTTDANYAEILRAALHFEGIKCAVDGERQAGFTGLPTLPIAILVRAIDFDRARKFIETHNPK